MNGGLPTTNPGTTSPAGGVATPSPSPFSPSTPLSIPDHTLLHCIGSGSYGEVWLARSALGTLRAVKLVRRSAFDDDRPYEREFAGLQKFEPLSRTHDGFVDLLQVGRNDAEGWFYYVMELADAVGGAEEKASDNGSVAQDPSGLSTPNPQPLLPSPHPRRRNQTPRCPHA